MILLEGLSHFSQGTADLQRSITFYRDLLDFELIEEEDNYAVLKLDPVAIRLNLIEGYQSPVKNPAEACLSFILDVDDFTNAIVELEENNIEILKGPVSIEGGEAVLISDPDGNLIELYYNE